MDNELEKFKEILAENPGNPLFAEYAERLRVAGDHSEAMNVCLAGLSANPACHRGRLVLARAFYDRSYLPFAVRELEYLVRELPDNESLRKLLNKLSPQGTAAPSQTGPAVAAQTVAEAEFDFSDIELIGQKKE